MKRKVWGILLFLLVGFSALSWTDAKVNSSFGDIPPFKILQTNGTFFTATELPKNKPVVLVYFSPDCEHCQVLMNAMFKRINEFKKTELVLVTFKPLEELIGFENSYGTKKYPFIKTGTEGNTFFLRYYYKIQTTPFTAIFDKNGKLVASYRKDTKVDELIRQVRQLK